MSTPFPTPQPIQPSDLPTPTIPTIASIQKTQFQLLIRCTVCFQVNYQINLCSACNAAICNNCLTQHQANNPIAPNRQRKCFVCRQLCNFFNISFFIKSLVNYRAHVLELYEGNIRESRGRQEEERKREEREKEEALEKWGMMKAKAQVYKDRAEWFSQQKYQKRKSSKSYWEQNRIDYSKKRQGEDLKQYLGQYQKEQDLKETRLQESQGGYRQLWGQQEERFLRSKQETNKYREGYASGIRNHINMSNRNSLNTSRSKVFESNEKSRKFIKNAWFEGMEKSTRRR